MTRTKGRSLLIAGLLLLVSTLATGCWDRREINDIAIVVGSALDQDEDGNVRYTVQMPLPGNMGGPNGGGGGSSGTKTFYIDSETGKTAREAAMKMQLRMSRRFFLAHRRVMLVGEDYAKQVGIRTIFDSMPRLPESRMTTFLIITKGKAYDVLNANPRFERFSSEAMREIAQSPTVINIKLKDVATALAEDGTDPIVPYMGIKESEKSKSPSEEIEHIGFALFRNDKMVGVAKGAEMHGLEWLRSKIKSYTDSIDIGGGQYMTYMMKEGSASTTCSISSQNQVRIRIALRGNAIIEENQSLTDLSKLGGADEAERLMNQQVKASVMSVLDRTKRQQIDVAAFGTLLWRSFPEQWVKTFSRDWRSQLADLSFEVKADTHFSNYGLIFENITKGETK